MHDSAEAVIVVHRVMHHTTIIPKCQRAFTPAEASGEFRFLNMFPQKVNQRQGFVKGKTFDTLGVRADVEAFATGFRMGPY